MTLSIAPSPRQGPRALPALRPLNLRGRSADINEFHRARIIAAMADVASQNGGEHASVAKVIARVGLSRRTFYQHFANGQECLLAVFDDALARATIRVHAAYAVEGPWVARLRGAVLALLALLDESPDLARLCVLRLHTDDPAMRGRRRQLLEMVAGALDDGRCKLAASRQPPPFAGEAAAGAGLSLLYTALMDRQAGLRDELFGPLVATLLFSYRGPAAARRELSRPVPKPRPAAPPRGGGVALAVRPRMRVTYRTAQVLSVIATNPGVSNRVVASGAGIRDQGQISKLLARLRGLGLIDSAPGEPGVNAWQLTREGETLCRELGIAVLARDGSA
jgi:AcrR family transcriptional regulator